MIFFPLFPVDLLSFAVLSLYCVELLCIRIHCFTIESIHSHIVAHLVLLVRFIPYYNGSSCYFDIIWYVV